MVGYLVDHTSARMGGVGYDVQVDETLGGTPQAPSSSEPSTGTYHQFNYESYGS